MKNRNKKTHGSEGTPNYIDTLYIASYCYNNTGQYLLYRVKTIWL